MSAQLKAALGSVTVPSGIDKVVAFSCSTMIYAEKPEAVKASMAQHILALAIRDLLAARYGKAASEITCYAQDPIYTRIDEQVLVDDEGVVVLDDPAGFLQVDENCVFLAIASHIPVRQIVADIARPAILLWDKVEVSGLGEDGQVPSSSRSFVCVKGIR